MQLMTSEPTGTIGLWMHAAFEYTGGVADYECTASRVLMLVCRSMVGTCMNCAYVYGAQFLFKLMCVSGGWRGRSIVLSAAFTRFIVLLQLSARALI